jgi:predicted PurR-regulated permease PerM
MDNQKQRKNKRSLLTSRTFYILILAGVSVLFFFIARKFIMPVLLAAISAGLFWPVHTRIRTLLGRKEMSALLSMVAVILIILVPLGLIGYFILDRLLEFARQLAHDIQSTKDLLEKISQILGKIPILRTIDPVEILTGDRFLRFIQQFGTLILENVGSLADNMILVLIKIFIYLYSLYFFLKEGDCILRRVIGLFPLRKRYQNMVTERFISVTRATLKSTFIIGSIQGAIGGIALYLLELKGAILWGVLLMFLAIIPNVGAIIVWFPASIVLFAKGNLLGGGIMILVGFIIVMTEYILRPRLIGKDIQIHQVLVLIGVMGGIALFGVFGFIIGPILMSLFVILWDMFREAVVDEQTK